LDFHFSDNSRVDDMKLTEQLCILASLRTFKELMLNRCRLQAILFEKIKTLHKVLPPQDPSTLHVLGLPRVDSNGKSPVSDEQTEKLPKPESSQILQEVAQCEAPPLEEMLLQKVLSKAASPSPVKATYTVEELELAALVLSQHLTQCQKSSKTDRPLSEASVTPTPTSGALSPGTNFASFNEFRNDRNVVHSPLERTNKSCRNKEKGEVVPSATVRQLIEMGFERRPVERAVKMLGRFPNTDTLS